MESPEQPLPHPMELLIGRDALLERITYLVLHEGVRLVTLTGPGGVGKSRLALTAAHRLLEEFDSRAAFVDVSTVEHAEDVLSSLTRALGVREGRGDEPAMARLGEVLRGERYLVVLDNLEHVLDVAPELGKLLHACPHTVMIATSREPLRVRGEQEVPVEPLELPSAPALALQQLAATPAVALFVRGARSVLPDFELDEHNAAAVAAICRRLDGLPLAIQLASARVRVLAPQALLPQLDDVLSLSSRARDVPARHRTLRAAIEWSDGLLDARERDAFHRLSVAVGGLDLVAAEAIIGADAMARVESLVEKSLVVARRAGASPRFSMLETIREYAYEQLRADGNLDDARTRHAHHYTTLAETLSKDLQGPRQRERLHQLELERDNLRASFRWLLDHGDAERVGRAGAGSWLLWGITGDLREGAAWMAEVLQHGSVLTPATRAGALLVLGLAAIQGGSVGDAVPRLEESLALYEESGDRRGAALALLFLGRDEASRRLFADLGDAAGQAFALATASEMSIASGDIDAADATYQASLQLAREAQDMRAVEHALNGLGLVALLRGHARQAVRLLLESATLCLELEHEAGIWYPLLDLAAVHRLLGDPLRAATLMGAVEALRVRQGVVVPPEQQVISHRLQGLRTQLSESAYATALDDGRRLTLAQALDLARGSAAASTPRTGQGPSALDGPAALTAREREVAALIGRGMTSRQIAEALIITERTADTHAERIRGKLGLRSRAEIAAWAARHSLVS